MESRKDLIKRLIFTASCFYIMLEFTLGFPILMIMYFTYTEKIIGSIMLILTFISTVNIVIIGGKSE